MLKTFNAILKNNSIQWLDEVPNIELDTSVKIPGGVTKKLRI